MKFMLQHKLLKGNISGEFCVTIKGSHHSKQENENKNENPLLVLVFKISNEKHVLFFIWPNKWWYTFP